MINHNTGCIIFLSKHPLHTMWQQAHSSYFPSYQTAALFIKPSWLALCCLFSHLNPLHVFVKPLNLVTHIIHIPSFFSSSADLGSLSAGVLFHSDWKYFWKHHRVRAHSSAVHPVCYPSIWRASRPPSIILTSNIQRSSHPSIWQHTGWLHGHPSILQSINLLTH